MKFGGVASIGGTTEQSVKVFLCEKRISRQFVKVFSLESLQISGMVYSSDSMKLHLYSSSLLANVVKCQMVISTPLFLISSGKCGKMPDGDYMYLLK